METETRLAHAIAYLSLLLHDNLDIDDISERVLKVCNAIEDMLMIKK